MHTEAHRLPCIIFLDLRDDRLVKLHQMNRASSTWADPKCPLEAPYNKLDDEIHSVWAVCMYDDFLDVQDLYLNLTTVCCTRK